MRRSAYSSATTITIMLDSAATACTMNVTGRSMCRKQRAHLFSGLLGFKGFQLALPLDLLHLGLMLSCLQLHLQTSMPKLAPTWVPELHITWQANLTRILASSKRKSRIIEEWTSRANKAPDILSAVTKTCKVLLC